MPDHVAIYRDAKALADQEVPQRLLIQAAMLQDGPHSETLARAFPGLHFETMQRRHCSPDGRIAGDAQTDAEPQPEKLEALGRD